MAISRDTPISGLPETTDPLKLSDLLISSIAKDDDKYRTVKITVKQLRDFLAGQFSIDDVAGLADQLDSFTNDISSLAPKSHTHVISDIVSLADELASRSLIGHGHAMSQVSGLIAALNTKTNIGHEHEVADVRGLTEQLAIRIKEERIGTPLGLAQLDGSCKLLVENLPAFAIRFFDNNVLPAVGVANIIYISNADGKMYTYDSVKREFTTFGSIANSGGALTLGETELTAFRGDYGLIAFNHAGSKHAPVDAEKNVQTDWNASAGISAIANKPSVFPPELHMHSFAELIGDKPKIYSGDDLLRGLSTLNTSPESIIDGDNFLEAISKLQKQINITSALSIVGNDNYFKRTLGPDDSFHDESKVITLEPGHYRFTIHSPPSAVSNVFEEEEGQYKPHTTIKLNGFEILTTLDVVWRTLWWGSITKTRYGGNTDMYAVDYLYDSEGVESIESQTGLITDAIIPSDRPLAYMLENSKDITLPPKTIRDGYDGFIDPGIAVISQIYNFVEEVELELVISESLFDVNYHEEKWDINTPAGKGYVIIEKINPADLVDDGLRNIVNDFDKNGLHVEP